MIRNATPARKRLPVKNQTIKPTMAAGKMNKRTSAIRIMMRSPITRKRTNNKMSNTPEGSAGMLIIGKKIPPN